MQLTLCAECCLIVDNRKIDGYSNTPTVGRRHHRRTSLHTLSKRATL